MNDKEIDAILDQGARVPHEVDSAVLRRVSTSMAASMHPVQPIAPVATLAGWLLLLVAGIAIVFAGVLGFEGVRKLTIQEIGAIFPALAIFTWLAALASVAAMTPGSLRWKNAAVMEAVMVNPLLLLAVIVAVWIALTALFLDDYRMGSFLSDGIPCLRAGLVAAIPAGIGSWLLLRRGFAVSPTPAGLAAGILAGLAGVIMLELHCGNLLAPHVMVWHTAVVPISGLVGAVLARIASEKAA